MILLLILLLCSSAFGADYEKFLTEDSLTIARTNAGDMRSLKRMHELRMIVARKAFDQRHPYYHWLIPEKIKPEIAARAPAEGEITDYLLGIDVTYDTTKSPIVHLEWEQQNGKRYVNYVFNLQGDKNEWRYRGESRRSQARDINRQKLSVRHKLWFMGVGVAATSERYDSDAVYGLLDFYIPLGKKGHVGYATNLAGLEIWDVKLYIESNDDSRFKPNIEGKFYKAGRELDWGVSFGFSIKLRGTDG